MGSMAMVRVDCIVCAVSRTSHHRKPNSSSFINSGSNYTNTIKYTPKKRSATRITRMPTKRGVWMCFFLAVFFFGWMDLQFSPVFVEIPADSFRRQIGRVNKVAGLSPCPIFGNKQNHRWYNPLDLNIGDSPGFGNPGQVFFIEALKLESCNRQFGRDVSALTFFVPCRKRLEKKRFRGGRRSRPFIS